MTGIYNPPITHTGIATFCGVEIEMRVRETKMYWVNDQGVKFSKDTGCPAGDKSGLVRFDEDTLERIIK